MKYTAAAIAKSLVAFGVGTIGAATAAAGGPDLSGLDFGQWLAAVAAGLTGAGAVFATPNKPTESAADIVVSSIPVVVEQAKQAQDDLERVRQVTTDVLRDVPVFGPAAREIVNSLPRF
ncbi:MAG: hypothetical protein K0U84_18460 [Actinomycetia bacterium]|nr:hypothetical protein [Actinomycetes bacterium]